MSQQLSRPRTQATRVGFLTCSVVLSELHLPVARGLHARTRVRREANLRSEFYRSMALVYIPVVILLSSLFLIVATRAKGRHRRAKSYRSSTRQSASDRTKARRRLSAKLSQATKSRRAWDSTVTFARGSICCGFASEGAHNPRAVRRSRAYLCFAEKCFFSSSLMSFTSSCRLER